MGRLASAGPSSDKSLGSMNDWYEAEQRVEKAHELFEQRKWQEALEELMPLLGPVSTAVALICLGDANMSVAEGSAQTTVRPSPAERL